MKLIDRREVASRIGCSVSTIDRLVRTGVIPEPIKVAGMVRWPDEKIDQWIAQGCPRSPNRTEEQLCAN